MSQCITESCTRPNQVRGFCRRHYMVEIRAGRLTRIRTLRPGHGRATYSNPIHHPTYNSWSSMRRRCTDPRDVGYKYYGGRGIKVCKRWLESFPNFVEDLGERPAGKTLDRIDHNGNYEPGNVRWANKHEQAANKSTTTKTVGVRYDKYHQRWEVSLVIDGYNVLTGMFFDNREDAIRTRRLAVKKYLGY